MLTPKPCDGRPALSLNPAGLENSQRKWVIGGFSVFLPHHPQPRCGQSREGSGVKTTSGPGRGFPLPPCMSCKINNEKPWGRPFSRRKEFILRYTPFILSFCTDLKRNAFGRKSSKQTSATPVFTGGGGETRRGAVSPGTHLFQAGNTDRVWMKVEICRSGGGVSFPSCRIHMPQEYPAGQGWACERDAI